MGDLEKEYDYYTRNLLIASLNFIKSDYYKIYNWTKEMICWRLATTLNLELSSHKLIFTSNILNLLNLLTKTKEKKQEKILLVTLPFVPHFLNMLKDKRSPFAITTNPQPNKFFSLKQKISGGPYSFFLLDNPLIWKGGNLLSPDEISVFFKSISKNQKSAPASTPTIIYLLHKWYFLKEYEKYIDISFIDTEESKANIIYVGYEEIPEVPFKIYWMYNPYFPSLSEKEIIMEANPPDIFTCALWGKFFEDTDMFKNIVQIAIKKFFSYANKIENAIIPFIEKKANCRVKMGDNLSYGIIELIIDSGKYHNREHFLNILERNNELTFLMGSSYEINEDKLYIRLSIDFSKFSSDAEIEELKKILWEQLLMA